MSIRYLTNAFIALLGGFVVVASMTFASATVGWIGFGFGIAVVAVSVLAQLERSRGASQRIMDLMMVALGGLAMAFGVGATGSDVIWTVFAFALGWVATSFFGLTLHEIETWRSTHSLGTLHVPHEWIRHHEEASTS